MPNLDWSEIGRRIKEAMRQRRVSSTWVAQKSGIDRRTVDRARSGERIREENLLYIEEVLGLSLVDDSLSMKYDQPIVAPEELGSYAIQAYKEYTGKYLMFRNSFDSNDRVICSFVKVFIDQDGKCLSFSEKQRNKSEQGRLYYYDIIGSISIPPGCGVLQFVSNQNGHFRVMTMTTFRVSENNVKSMRGLICTLNEIIEVGFYPVASPVYLMKAEDSLDDRAIELQIGSFRSNELSYPAAVQALRDCNERFSAFQG